MSTPPSIKTIFQRNISLYTKSFPQEPEPIGTPDHSGTHFNSGSFRNPLELRIIQEPVFNSWSFRNPLELRIIQEPIGTPDHSGTHWNSGSFRNPLELRIIQEPIGTPDHSRIHWNSGSFRNPFRAWTFKEPIMSPKPFRNPFGTLNPGPFRIQLRTLDLFLKPLPC